MITIDREGKIMEKTEHENEVAAKIGPVRYFFLTLLVTVFVPAAIASVPALFLATFSLAAVVTVTILIGLGALIYRMNANQILPRTQAALVQGRLPQNALVLYSPFFLPLFYALIITSIGFWGNWEDMDGRMTFFMWSFGFPYFFALFIPLFLVIFGGNIELLPAVPLVMTSLTAIGGGFWLFRYSPHRVRQLPTVVALALVSVALSVLVFHNQTEMRGEILSSDSSVETVRDEQFQPAWENTADETDLEPYLPFSGGNKLKTVENEANLSIEIDYPHLHGALALYPVYAAAAQAIYKDISADQAEKLVQGGTSPAAFSALITGQADMVFMLPPSEKQVEEAKKLGKTLTVTPIGREAFVFFVSNVNPIDELSSQQIRDIYSKKITRWSELGGPRTRILPFQRPEGSGSQTAMQRFMGSQPLAKPIREEYQQLMGGIINRVADYRNYGNSIGYSFRYYVEGMFKHDGVKLLRIDGIEPNPTNIRNGSYPLCGEMVIVTAGTENPNVPKLIDWFLSPQGQTLIEQVGYVPLYTPNGNTDKD